MKSMMLSAAGLVALTMTATAAPDVVRLRGTIESVSGDSVTIKTTDGKTQMIAIANDTKFASVVNSSLSDVKDGVFIGTATKGENPPVALEVVVFPDSMKGTAEGHYAWDSIQDTTAGGKMTKSSMTNGTIKSSSSGTMTKSSMTNGTVKSTSEPMTKSSMTNGTVKSDKSAGGSKKLVVTYDNGKSLDITVPATAPVVALDPSDKSIAKAGAKLFAVTAPDKDGHLTGKLLLIGKDGVTPPM